MIAILSDQKQVYISYFTTSLRKEKREKKHSFRYPKIFYLMASYILLKLRHGASNIRSRGNSCSSSSPAAHCTPFLLVGVDGIIQLQVAKKIWPESEPCAFGLKVWLTENPLWINMLTIHLFITIHNLACVLTEPWIWLSSKREKQSTPVMFYHANCSEQILFVLVIPTWGHSSKTKSVFLTQEIYHIFMTQLINQTMWIHSSKKNNKELSGCLTVDSPLTFSEGTKGSKESTFKHCKESL